MLAKASLILTLIVSLLFVTQAQPLALTVEMKPGGVCAGMPCGHGCCAKRGVLQGDGAAEELRKR